MPISARKSSKGPGRCKTSVRFCRNTMLICWVLANNDRKAKRVRASLQIIPYSPHPKPLSLRKGRGGVWNRILAQ